jgi:Fe-Mn family superoxide dismutase
MFTNRRSLILGSAAVVAASAMGRGYAQSPAGPYKLDPLPYPPSKNEPYIDTQTMEIHHDRHHAAYVNNLNGVMTQQPDLAKRPLLELACRRPFARRYATMAEVTPITRCSGRSWEVAAANRKAI